MKSAPRADGAMTPERAATERASRGGVSLAWFHTNSEGPRRGRSLLGCTRRQVGGLGSMPSPSDRSMPAGQKKTSTEWEEKRSRPRHRQSKRLHAVRNKGECAARGNEAEDTGRGRLSG